MDARMGKEHGGEAHPAETESNKLLNKNPSNPSTTKCERNGKVSTKSRTILWHAAFWGFAINYMARCNLNLAIVSIVVPKRVSTNSLTKPLECFNMSSNFPVGNSTDHYQYGDEMRKYFSLERIVMDLFMIDYNKNGFEWTEYEQGQCLGSFYWLFWSTQLLGGYLANRFGTKLVFGLSNFLSCGLSFLIPTAAYLNFKFLLIVRMLQGALSGFSFPAMHHITSQWIPPNERSRFISAYMGCSVGVAICYPIFGFIISISSWEWTFHFCSVATVVWFIFWQYCVYDSPADHPRIESSELNYITKALGSTSQKDKKAPIPWTSIFKSIPFWITVCASWGSVWQLYTLMIQLPTYFKFIHGFDIRMSGLFSGGPHFLRMGFSYIFSSFVDYLLHSKSLSRTNARKVAVFVSCIFSGSLCIGLAYAGCNSNLVIVLTTASIALLGAQSAGTLPSFVELASNYSSILLGISQTICVLPGILSSHIVGVLTNNQQTREQWKYVFLITAGMSILSGLVFVLFSSSDEQSWNKSSKSVEMKPLNESKCVEIPREKCSE
ncbi:sialin-like isoform X2 [Bradysia coprophila]|uniref:sialin-like isoform X2 n=1 Tax=Bradysia coprophila TaxID=38358 RepID=UPI00187DD008|nr:sialin-like isoform X2 [Bradysia coprophila]